MHKSSRIYVAGHRGLVGSAVLEQLRAGGHSNLIVRSHAQLDLTVQAAVADFFARERPEYVFLCAAKTGGILANATYPAEFLHINLALQTNVLHAAWRAGVKRLLFLGSSCIYPRDCPQPMREEYLLSGPLEPTNRPYAVAKIAGVETCWSYNRQHGTQFLAAMPTNLYGPGDNYDRETSHVLPALVRKLHEAREAGRRTVTAWGSGSPKREFLFSHDLAGAAIFLMRLDDAALAPLLNDRSPPLINVGFGEEITIRDLAGRVQRMVGYSGEVMWDRSKPDGSPRKLLDSTRLRGLGWAPETPLNAGIRLAYADFLARYA